jgi:hypothetical protein
VRTHERFCNRAQALVVGSLLVAALCLMPDAASAQSAIAGQVRDNTGALLPGVTVEAASAALIEGQRTAVTDGQGRYSIVDLRPGVYVVTFSLPGFSRVVREGIELTSNFTATVEATLNVGSIEESITVSGAAPLVDVHQSNTTQTLTRDVLDSLPIGRSLWEQGNLVSGVRMTGTDVGGTQYGADLQLEAHGASSLHSATLIDGVGADNIQRDSSDNLKYYAEVGNQEVVFETTGASAEFAAGGVILNMIPKDGGNSFSGAGYLGGTNGSWQSSNFTDRLRRRGVTTLGRLDQIFDYSVTQGGPIVENRLWFFGALRYWGRKTPVANSFYDDGSQYITSSAFLAPNPRFTAQVTPRNKLIWQIERSGPIVGPRLDSPATYPAKILPGQRGSDPETATLTRGGRRPYGAWLAKWTSTISSRLLFEAGYSNTFVLDGGSDRQPGVGPERVRMTDLDQGVTWNTNWQFTAWRYLNEARGAVSYVTGSHKIKTGLQYKWGTSAINLEPPGDIDNIRYRSGVPDSVLVGNYPVKQFPVLNYDVGMFVQDSWTIDRLTLNPGVRVEWVKSGTDEQTAPAGRFVGPRRFAPVEDLPKFGPNVAPRFGVAYDLFGNGRTALKFSVGKYNRRHTVTLAERLTPMAPVTVSLPWTDRDRQGRDLATNSNGFPEDNELDFTRLPVNFGERRLDTLDPDLKREYNVETGLSVQHQLIRNVAVTAGWYRRSFHNMYVDQNPVRGFGDYRPIDVVSPYNGEIITIYDLRSASLLPLVDAVVTNSTENRHIYHGFEFGAQARLPGGGMLLFSSSTERTMTRTCDVGSAAAIPDAPKGTPDDPNLQRFCDRFDLPAEYRVPWQSGFKLSGSYQLPFRVQASATYTDQPGRGGQLVDINTLLPINWLISQSTRYTAEQCSGRPCTPNALVVPNMVLSSITVALVPSGTVRLLERQRQLNLGVRKQFRTGRLTYAAEFDLYNALNADTVLNVVSNNFGTASYDVPSSVLPGRMPRIALRLQW